MIKEFSEDYYNKDYFVTPGGKKCIMPDGSTKQWSYNNPTGEWEFAANICKAWKNVFNPNKMLDVGAGRGTFIGHAIDAGIDARGFDFSKFAVSDGRFSKCPPHRLIQHDVTNFWPYDNEEFDFVICLDLIEHIYESDIDFVLDEMFRVTSKYAFLQIATSPNINYSLKRGEEVPKELEVFTLTGHLHMMNKEYWIDKLLKMGWKENKELLNKFYSSVIPSFPVDSAWVKNLVIVLEK